MTRHEKFKKILHNTLAVTGPQDRTLTNLMLISIAGSLCLIADALNPEAAQEQEEDKKTGSGYIFREELEK